MNIKLLGFKKIKSNKNGKDYVILSIGYNSNFFEGVEADKIIVPAEVPENLIVNGDYDVSCDFNGKVTSMSYISLEKGDRK